MFNGTAVRDSVCALLVLAAFAVGATMCIHSTGCALFEHEEARSAAEMGCVERYKTTAQIEACREVVNGITSKYAKDAGPKDAAE